MAESAGSPVFADRYRFETVSDDWDKGRSGFTHLVYDLKLERLGVMKRAEIISKSAVDGLKREAETLKRLKGPGIPDVYETGEAIYGSKVYFYMVLEYIDTLRVEKNLGLLTKDERAEILTQLFGLLTKAHQMGVVNGDVDLKHLFWSREKKQLTVIDWGNARVGVDPQKATEFAYDLARSAEIVYSLITSRGHPSATGSIALPTDASLIRDLAPIPAEFRQLCKWAPRTPTEGLRAPYTAAELFDISQNWKNAVHNMRPYQPPKPHNKWTRVLGIVLLLAVAAAAFTIFGLPYIPSLTPTSSSTETQPATTVVSVTPPAMTETLQPSPTYTATVATATQTLTATSTPTPTMSPAPGTLTTPIWSLDNNFVVVDPDNPCWEDTTNIAEGLIPLEGFSRRDTDHYWRFGIEKNRTPEEYVRTYFKQECLDAASVQTLGMDISILHLEAGREFGFFLEDAQGNRREYTVTARNEDNTDRVYLKVRNNADTNEYEQLIDNLKTDKHSYLHPYYQFALQIFFERNNHGLDIIYLHEGSLQAPGDVNTLDPSKMTIIPQAVLPKMDNVVKIGLIGYGGEIQIAIWPFVFFGH